MKCPYDKKVSCKYIDYASMDKVYACCDCPHYSPMEHHSEPFAGRSRLGCLIIGIIILAGFLIGMGFLIHYLRP